MKRRPLPTPPQGTTNFNASSVAAAISTPSPTKYLAEEVRFDHLPSPVNTFGSPNNINLFELKRKISKDCKDEIVDLNKSLLNDQSATSSSRVAEHKFFTVLEATELDSFADIRRKFLILCLAPNIDTFHTFISPLLYLGHTKGEKRLNRKKLYESIIQRKEKAEYSSSVSLLQKKISYLSFASMLKDYSDRWRSISSEEVLSFVILIDQSMKGYINFDTIETFYQMVDDANQTNPLQPNLVRHDLFLFMINQLNSAAGTHQIDPVIKNKLLVFIQRLRYGNHSVHVLNLYCAFLMRNDDESQESCLPVTFFWDEMNRIYGSSIQDSNENNFDLCDSKRDPSPRRADNKGRSVNSPIPLASTIRDLNNEVSPTNTNISDFEALRSKLLLRLEIFKNRSSEIAKELQNADSQMDFSLNVWQELAAMEQQLQHARELLPSPAQQGRGVSEQSRSPKTSPRSSLALAPDSDMKACDLRSNVSEHIVPSNVSEYSSIIRQRKEAIELKYGVQVSSQRVNLKAIKSPSRRLQHGNVNRFDPEKMAWVPTVLQKRTDERFHTSKELMLDKETIIKFYQN